MDRLTGRFLIASPFAAVPIVLLMASLSNGTTPNADSGAVQFAIPQLAESGGDEPVIRQVAGKQTRSRQNRPGLFEVITGSQTSGNRDHRHKNMREDQSRGLLDSLFGSRKSESNHSKSHAGHQHRSGQKHQHSHSRKGNQKESVNWDGIPYHQPNKSREKRVATPVQDPGSSSVAQRPTSTHRGSTSTSPKRADRTTRIVRGRSSKSTNAHAVSARTKSFSTVAKQKANIAGIPQPPADLGPTPEQSERISVSSSNRRSGRRDLRALEASITRKRTAATKKAKLKTKEEEVTLVPRVDMADKVASADETASADEPTKAPDPVNPKQKSPAPNTALAAIGTPTVTPEANVSTGGSPSNSEPNGDYTVPVDPSTNPVPIAGIPSHPFAASAPSGSTPALSITHRSGPPSSAFQAAPYSGSPIGSGVVPRGDVTAFGQASDPAFQTARLPGSASDPYGSHTHSPSNRLTTNGQPVETNGPPSIESENYARPDNSARTNSDLAAVPMHPIPGHQPSVLTGPTVTDSSPRGDNFSGDNFSRSTDDTRNQMRGVDGTTTNGVGSKAGSATSELPGIRVVTQGPSEIMIRQTSQFEIRVENRGSIDAQGVLVRASVPDWANLGGQNASVGSIDVRELGSGQQLVWTIDHLPAGTSERMFVRLTAARSGNHGLDVDWTLLPQKSVAQIQVHEPRLELTIEGPDEVVYGKSQTYIVHVLNPGDGTASDVMFTLSPNSATPQTQRIGDIPPGKEAQFDVELTAQDLGDLKIHGLAVAELELRAEAAKTIRVSAAKLEAMFNGPELKYQNTDATYNLQVRNTGTVASEKIMATLRIPAGVEYVGGIDESGPQGDSLQWEIISLPPGATRDYQFTCKMDSTGDHLFAFDCKGTAAGQTDVSISTRVESIADLVLTVNDPTAPAPIGSDVTYEIVIRNRGSKEAIDVRAVAQFSSGIEPQRIEGQSGKVVTGQVLFDPISRIGAGQEVRLRVIARADRAGHHRFRSEVRSGDTVLIAEEATHYMSSKSERVSRHSSDSSAR